MSGASATPTLIAPSSLEAALQLMAVEPGQWRPFAGGTDLMVAMNAPCGATRGILSPLPLGRGLGEGEGTRGFINLLRYPELHGITVADDTIELGACTTYTQIRGHALLQREFAMLCAAASLTGGVAIQNRGTLGGNIANASPAADSLPVLLAYDAAIALQSMRGIRWVPYDTVHTGYKQTILAPDELITRIRLPRPRAPRVEFFRKVGTREAQSITKVSLAACATRHAQHLTDVRLGMGSVGPMPLRCRRTEAVLQSEIVTATTIAAAQRALLEDIAPIDDLRSTAAYRRRVAQNLLAEFLQQAMTPRG
ncbi:MAG: xanthine dehydrogenase family protein subunit M [Deltaproteobacteria bacterium]|nr:xanthine dehydrogenase family protein subunit M [Deltaproteobacteria bacterium]